MNDISLFIDPLLIMPYRLPGNALVGFFFGTACVALLCVVIGDISQLIVSYLNRKRLGELQAAMLHNHKLSETALRMGDKESYKAVNKQGHDAFGHFFSLGAALFCVSIWPMPFILGWMTDRFNGVTPVLPWELPITGANPPIVFWFLLLYIPLRMAYAKILGRFPWYARLRPAPTPPPSS